MATTMTSPRAAATEARADERRIYNPVQRDAATFLETSEESDGERTLAELEVAPGGRVTPHYHLTYAEHFRAREGRLTVRIGNVRHELDPGDEAVAHPGQLHAWSNETSAPVLAYVELRPGTRGSRRRCVSATGSPPAVASSRTARRATRCTSR